MLCIDPNNIHVPTRCPPFFVKLLLAFQIDISLPYEGYVEPLKTTSQIDAKVGHEQLCQRVTALLSLFKEIRQMNDNQSMEHSRAVVLPMSLLEKYFEASNQLMVADLRILGIYGRFYAALWKDTPVPEALQQVSYAVLKECHELMSTAAKTEPEEARIESKGAFGRVKQEVVIDDDPAQRKRKRMKQFQAIKFFLNSTNLQQSSWLAYSKVV